MAAKGEMSETDSKLKYVNMGDEEVKSLHNDEKERETCATMSEKRNDYNHKKKEKSGKQTVIMVKPKPLTKKQLQAAEHRRRKEMEEIGRQLLEQQKKQEVDKMSGQQKKEKDKEHKQTTVTDLQAEIEEQKAQSEMEQQKLEAKQRLLEAQEKKKEKRKKKKEMKHTKKLVQQEAKQRLEELHSRGISQRCFKETVSFEEEEKLSTLDDLEPLPPLEGTFRKKDHLWNLPPRLSALRTNQSNSQCNTGKDSKVQVSKGEEPSKIEQVEKRGHPKSDHQKTSHVLQRRPEKFEDKENMPSPLHETKLSPVCRQAPLIEHDPELTSHHLEQYRELMLVQPERQTQCQLRGKVSKVGLHKAEMLKRQQEREAQRNEEEMMEILAVEKQKHRALYSPPCPEEDWTLLPQVPTEPGIGYPPCTLDAPSNPWERRKQLLEELTPESVEDEEKMLAQAMEMSLHVRDKSARDRYKTGYHAGEAALTPCQWVLSDIGYHLVHNSLNQDFPSVPDNYQLNSSYDDLPEGAFGESKPCPSYADRLTAEWRPRSQPINCDPTSAVPHVNQVNKECRTAEGIRNTVVDFNSTNSHKSVETGQSHSSHSDMNQIDVTPTTSDCKLLSQMEPHLNRDPHSFSHHSLGSWEVPISKTDNTDWSCTTVNSHKKPPQLPHAPGIVLERGIPDQTLDTVQPSNSSFFRPEEREWSKTCESWDTTDTENVRFPLEMSQSEQPEDGWSKMDQTDVLMQFHSKDTSGDGSNTPNNNPPAMGSTCLSTSPEEKFLSNNQNEEQTDQFDTPIPTVRTNANFGVNDRTDQQLPSHSEASLGNTNTQSSPAAFSFRHLKINAIRKPNDSNSAAQPNSGTEVRNNSVSAPFVLPPAHEDWGTELIEDILVIADDLQRKERESDTVYIPSSENVDRKPEQDQGIITPNANVPNHSQIALDPQERPTENSTPENLERRDLEAMNERIQSTSQLWVNEVDNSVDESGDHDGPGGNSSSEFFPPRAHRKIDHFPGLPSVLPDDLNIYMQYLAQNAAMAMMSNPLMMPLGASVPSFPALGHVPILGIPGMMPMMPNSHLWQHAMQLQFQQQQELLRQQMLHRQNGMQRTAGMGPLVEEETQREQAPHSLIAADKSRPDRSPGHQRAHVDHQDQQLMNDKGFPAETLIPENTASSPQESTYSLRLPKSNRPSFKIRVAFPAGERSQPSQSPPAGMDGSEHLIASQDSVSRDSVSHSNTAGVRLASVHDSSTQSESFTKRPGSGVRFPSRGRGHALSRRYQTSHSDRSNTSYNVVSTSAASGITQYRPQGGISSLKYKFPNDNNCSSDRSSGYQYKSQNTMNGTQDKDEDNPRYHRSVGNVSESQHRLLSDTSKANILSCKESWDAELLNVDVTIHGQPRQKYEQGHCPPQKVPSKGRGIRNSLAKITADNRGHSLGRQVIVKEEISDSDRRNY